MQRKAMQRIVFFCAPFKRKKNFSKKNPPKAKKTLTKKNQLFFPKLHFKKPHQKIKMSEREAKNDVHLPLTTQKPDNRIHKSYPWNPACQFSNEGCSRDLMHSKLCFWYAVRMSKWSKQRCDCSWWRVLCGDDFGQCLRLEYEPAIAQQRIPIFDTVKRKFYCCQSGQENMQCNRRCGKMFVCFSCYGKHQPLKEHEPPSPLLWIHEEAYKRAIDQRVTEGLDILKWHMTPYGPIYYITDPRNGGIITIDSCFVAVTCIPLFPSCMELLLFVSRWFEDCPTSLRFWS
jgi:hypothetical protein